MTDYATTHTTAVVSAPSLVDARWYLGDNMSFIDEMRGMGTLPTTPVEASSGGGRPTSGLVWPH